MPEKAEETDNCGVNTPAHTQKINKPKKISENSNTNKNETIENDKNHDHECTANIFQVDLCKRGTAKCVECKKIIIKDEVRIGKLVPFKEKQFLRFLHINCAFNSFRRARLASSVISDISQLDGADDIPPDDRQRIITRINEENKQRDKPLPERTAGKEKQQPVQAPSKTRTTRLKPSTLPNLPVMFTNADQLTPGKKVELMKLIETEKPLIVAISEVKPKNSDDRDMLDYDIPDYSLHPVNLDSSAGRGIAVYTHKSLDKSSVQIKPVLNFEEACLLEIKLRGGDTMIFGCFYRSPTKSETSDDNNNNLNNLIRCIFEKKYSHTCILGDFNFRDIDWTSGSTPHNEFSKESKFIETIRDAFLYQHVIKPTRRRGNDHPSVLDLILTDESMQVSDIAHHAPLGKSDHSVITFKFHCYLDHTKPKQVYSYDKARFPEMRNDLLPWVHEFMLSNEEKDGEEAWNAFKSKMYDIRGRFVPKRNVTGKPSWSKQGSIPVEKPLQDAIQNKKACHRKWMSSKNGMESQTTRADYTKARNKVKSLMRKAKKKYEKDICLQSKKNPKAFWAYVRQKLKTKAGVAPLLENNSDSQSTKFDDKDKANILQKQFASVFTKEPDGEIPQLERRTDTTINDIVITEEMVKQIIKMLNVNKSCGPDEIHPRMLIELADLICGPLALIMNKTLREKKIPEDWKKANVSPIFKKGARNRAENYRPISLTSIVCKLMESIIKEAVMNYVLSNKLLSSKQYGFISRRSTVTQLLRYLDKCVETMVKGGVTDTIYLDFAKAFDTVPHARLLGKLKAYGIDGTILAWIEAFLTGRTQVVKVNGEDSFSAPVLSGIPQGSVLGPLLFVIYINDLPETISSDVFLFADDTKIFREIASVNDSAALQRDIDSLEEWTKKWLLDFNVKKCHVLTLGKLENVKHTERYKLSGNELEHVFDEKDLGVTFDTDLTFENHIAAKISKANAIAGLIRRSFSFLDGRLFKRLYTTFVRPHLEYAQSVWAPHSQKQIDSLERVQMRATKMVDGMGSLDYPTRLEELGLPTLLYRRNRGDMIEVWKHLNVYDPETIPEHQLKLQNRGSREHDKKLIWKKPKDGTRGIQTNSFYFRTLQNWNDLPRSAAHAKSINEFKNELDDAWMEKPFKRDHKTTTQSGS